MMKIDTHHWVRCVQGHSMKDLDDRTVHGAPISLETEHLLAFIVHGAFEQHFESIKEKGLYAGANNSDRNHIHFAPWHDSCYW